MGALGCAFSKTGLLPARLINAMVGSQKAFKSRWGGGHTDVMLEKYFIYSCMLVELALTIC